jgi:heptosyltransferase-1
MAIRNILVVKLSAIGDVIHALPVAYAVKEQFPEAKITWVVEPPAFNLLEGNPYIDENNLFENKNFKKFAGFVKGKRPIAARQREKKYDIAFDLQGLFKSAAIVWLSRAQIKLGCCNMREGSNHISKPVIGPHAKGHIVERYLDVARSVGCKVDKVQFPVGITSRDEEVAGKLMQQAGTSIENKYVVLAVGANWPNKRWPTKYFAQLVDWLYNKNIIPVIIGGGTTDERLADEIEAAAEIPPINLVGKTTLRQLAYITKKSKAMFGGDTGPVHLAAGLGVPTVMVMGPTDANRNGPYGQAENVIEVNYSCKHCWKRQCRLGRDCLAKIEVHTVCDALQKLL